MEDLRSANEALAAYTAVGPEAPLGEIPATDLERWLAACEGDGLSAEHRFQKGWLHAEYGFQLRKSVEQGAVAEQYAYAGECFQTVTTDQDTGPIQRAEAYLALNAIATIRVYNSGGRNVITQSYNDRHLSAAAEVENVLVREDRTESERRFCQAFGVLLAVNYIEPSPYYAITMPSRFSNFREDPLLQQHIQLYDLLRGNEAAISDATVFDFLLKGPKPELPNDLERLLMVRACVGKMLHGTLTSDEERALRQLTHNVIQFVGQPSRRIKPKLTLPVAKPKPKQDEQPIDIPRVPMPALSVAEVTTDNILSWYSQQSNPRPFERSEGRQLGNFIEGVQDKDLSATDCLTLNRLRVDCAIAISGGDVGLAKDFIDTAIISLDALQKALVDFDAQYKDMTIYEAWIDAERAKFYRLLLLAKPIDGAARITLHEELSNILIEVADAAARTKDSHARQTAKSMSTPLLNAVLLMEHDEQYVSVPAMSRQHGGEQRLGWDLTVWHVGDRNRVAISNARKIRFVSEGTKLQRQGDIAIIPLPLIQQGNPLFLKNYVQAITEEDKHAQAKVDKALPSIIGRYHEALALLTNAR